MVSSGSSRSCVSRHSVVTRFSAGRLNGRRDGSILRLANDLNSTPIWPALERSMHSGCNSRWMARRWRMLRARSRSSPSSWIRRANAWAICAMSTMLNVCHGWLVCPGRADSCQNARMISGSRGHFASALRVLASACASSDACSLVSAMSRPASSRVASRAGSSAGHLASASRVLPTLCGSTSSHNCDSVATRSASCRAACLAQASLDHLLSALSVLERLRASRAVHRPAGPAIRCAVIRCAASVACRSPGHRLSAFSVLIACCRSMAFGSFGSAATRSASSRAPCLATSFCGHLLNAFSTLATPCASSACRN